MFATGETLGLAEWIIDDTCLVFFTFLGQIMKFTSPRASVEITNFFHIYLESWNVHNLPKTAFELPFAHRCKVYRNIAGKKNSEKWICLLD